MALYNNDISKQTCKYDNYTVLGIGIVFLEKPVPHRGSWPLGMLQEVSRIHYQGLVGEYFDFLSVCL